MAQDTTNFTKVQCDEITVPVVNASEVNASEINGRTDTITVIADVGTEKDLTLTAAQKKARLVEVTAASAKNLILGLEPGQWIVVKNNDANTALLVKNKAADTALSIAATKAALVIAGTGGSIISILTA
jgi:sarcosine oxidase gamma subunit